MAHVSRRRSTREYVKRVLEKLSAKRTFAYANRMLHAQMFNRAFSTRILGPSGRELRAGVVLSPVRASQPSEKSATKDFFRHHLRNNIERTLAKETALLPGKRLGQNYP